MPCLWPLHVVYFLHHFMCIHMCVRICVYVYGHIYTCMYTHGKKFWPQIFNGIPILLIMFQTSQQLHDIFNAYWPLFVSIFMNIEPNLTEQWAVKITIFCKNQTQVWLSLTSLWSPPKWQECTRLGCVHFVSRDAMGIRARTVIGKRI